MDKSFLLLFFKKEGLASSFFAPGLRSQAADENLSPVIKNFRLSAFRGDRMMSSTATHRNIPP